MNIFCFNHCVCETLCVCVCNFWTNTVVGRRKSRVLLNFPACLSWAFYYEHILLCHIKPLHVLLHNIHEPPLRASSFLSAGQLHLQHPLSNTSTVPALHKCKTSLPHVMLNESGKLLEVIKGSWEKAPSYWH